MRKSLVCLSSGQDSATVLYDTLANTNDKVYARYIRMKHFYLKNELDRAEQYVYKVVDWCQKNIRRFDFDVEISDPPRWSFFLQPEQRVYDQGVSKEFIEQFTPPDSPHFIDGVAYARNGKLGIGPTYSLERIWGWYKSAEYLNVDAVITGKDRAQNYLDIHGKPLGSANLGWISSKQQPACNLGPENGFFGPQFWKGITDIEFVKPLERMGRVKIYDYLPDPLKELISPCQVFNTNSNLIHSRSEIMFKGCGDCLSCFTRKVYNKKKFWPRRPSFSIQEIEELHDIYWRKIMTDKSPPTPYLPYGYDEPVVTLNFLKKIIDVKNEEEKANVMNGNFSIKGIP